MGLITLHFLISKQCSWRDREPRREEFTCRKISSTSPKSDKNVNTLTQPLIKNDCHNHAYHSRRTSVWIEHKQWDVLHTFSKGRKGWMMGSPAHPSRSRSLSSYPAPLLPFLLSCTMVSACTAWAVCSQEMNHAHVPLFGWGWSRRPSLCACRGQTAGAWLGAAAWQLRALPQLLRQCSAVVAPRALDSSCFSSQGLNPLILGYSANRGTTEIACPCSKWIILGNCPAWIAYGFKTWWS